MSVRLQVLALVASAAALSPALPSAAQKVVARPATGSEAEVVAIPAGSYVALYAGAGPTGGAVGGAGEAVPIRVNAFHLDRRPVTVRDYLAFLMDAPRWRRSRAAPLLVGHRYLATWSDDLAPAGGDPDRPVTEVSWFAARAYCSWTGGRLPTTDEWEYVAQAGATRTNAFGDRDFNARTLAFYQARPPAGSLPPVGSSDRNAFGVEDLHGLVWEWTEDFNDQVLTGSGRDDRGLDRQRFCAAGSVGTTDLTNYAGFLRYSYRASLDGTTGSPGLGFRCAR